MNHIQVYVVKDQRDDIVEKHPNLTGEVNLVFYEFDTPKDFKSATDKQIKRFVESRLQKKAWVNTDWDIENTEKVRVVQNYEIKKPVFEGDVEIPEKIVKISKKHSGKGRIQVV